MLEHEDIKNKRHPWIDRIQSFNELYHEEEDKDVEVNPGQKLGWIKGVLIPCLLSTWSSIIFFEIPWILANAGIFHTIIIIFLSLIIILITNLSISAISTNGKIKTGGLHFIISRSIGPDIGASISIILEFANMASAAINVLIFSDSLRSFIMVMLDLIITSGSTLEYSVLGVATIVMMSILSCICPGKETKAQNAPMLAIITAVFFVIFGAYKGPKTLLELAEGFTGFNMKTFKQNWHSNYRNNADDVKQSFFTIFAFFFPCVTGIHNGIKYSSKTLKNPSVSIPKGTLLSILITSTLYIVLIVVIGSVQLREASGYVFEVENGLFSNCSTRVCSRGLYKTNIDLLYFTSAWSNSLIVGRLAASISNAVFAFTYFPKLLQRMGQDDVYPLLKYLSNGYGKSKEPYLIHVVAMIVLTILYGFVCIYKDNLDDLLPLISTMYLFAYAMLNFCTFHVAYFKPLGWRPIFKFYNKWLSLAAAIICILLMIIIDKIMSIIVGCALCVLYLLARRKNEVINWGSSIQTQKIKTVIKNVYKVNTIQYHIKNYLPNLIVFTGNPESRKKLVSLAHLITKNNGIQMCVNIEKISLTPRQKKICLDKGIQWLRHSGINSLYVVIDNIELDLATHMIHSCGHGQLRPNIAMVGYKSDWLNCRYQDLQTYLNIFNVANMNNMSTIMVRVSSTESHVDQNFLIQDLKHDKNEEITLNRREKQNIRNQQKVDDCFVKINNEEFSFEQKKRNRGTVDVWWIYNDGGLSLMIAFILKHSNTWKNCKFRIYGVTNKVECLSEEKHKLKQVLSLYRIDFDYLDIILSNTTNPTTMSHFNSLLERAAEKVDQFDDYNLQREHIADTLFLRDLIELHSFNSDLIILTTPNNNEDINILFMCWIETISRGLPPCIIINGSTQSVLTVNA